MTLAGRTFSSGSLEAVWNELSDLLEMVSWLGDGGDGEELLESEFRFS